MLNDLPSIHVFYKCTEAILLQAQLSLKSHFHFENGNSHQKNIFKTLENVNTPKKYSPIHIKIYFNRELQPLNLWMRLFHHSFFIIVTKLICVKNYGLMWRKKKLPYFAQNVEFWKNDKITTKLRLLTVTHVYSL